MPKLKQLAQALPEFIRLIDFVVQHRYRPDDWDSINDLLCTLIDARFALMEVMVTRCDCTQEYAVQKVNGFIDACTRAKENCSTNGLRFLPLEELRAEITRTTEPLLFAFHLGEAKVQGAEDRLPEVPTRAPMLPRFEPGMSIRRDGEVWNVRYQDEQASLPVIGNKFVGWLVKLLEKPNYDFTVAELMGDPKGKLQADALIRGEGGTDEDGLMNIKRRLDDINEFTRDGNGTDSLEGEKKHLLQELTHSARLKAPVQSAYKNIATQKSLFLKKLSKSAGMPNLASHLKATIAPDGKALTIAYRPPAGTPSWEIKISQK